MRALEIVPDGWPCSLEECPPGPFINPKYPDNLCFKSEYHHEDGRVMAYNSAGEFYCLPDDVVQPVEMSEVER